MCLPIAVYDTGFSIGCRMYRHPVEIVTQTVKWPVLVVQALWGKSLGNPCFFAIFVFLNHNANSTNKCNGIVGLR